MDELEQFLKQAAARRAQGQGGQPQRRPAAAPQPPVQFIEPEIVEPEILDVPSADPYEANLTSVPSRQLPSSAKFQQRSAQMGQREQLADDMMEQHLHDTFDHDVGSLAGGSTTVASSYDESEYAEEDVTPYVNDEVFKPLADTLIEMLRNPTSIQHAIILNEVLQRPTDRW